MSDSRKIGDSRIGKTSIPSKPQQGSRTMLTGMTEDDWVIALKVFAAARSRCGQPGRDDRKFLEACIFLRSTI